MEGTRARGRPRRSRTALGVVLLLLCATLAAIVPSGTATAAPPKLPANAHWAHDAHGNPEAVYTIRIPAAALTPEMVQPDASARLTPAQAIASYKGIWMGPHDSTYGGKATLTSVSKHTPASGHDYWTANVSVTHPSPLVVMRPAGVHADSCAWYQMYCWAWGGVHGIIDNALPGFWENVLSPCIKGSEGGFIKSYGNPLMSKFWFYLSANADEVMDVSPTGLAISAIGGCTLGILAK